MLNPKSPDFHRLLTQELLYDPNSGLWIWMIDKNRVRRGQIAGTEGTRNGLRRRIIGFGGIQYYSSRLAWFYMNKIWPKEIDHINRDPLDDRWINLREVTHSENLENSNLGRDPLTGRFKSLE